MSYTYLGKEFYDGKVKKKTKVKGITLIALVITIIVLLIISLAY